MAHKSTNKKNDGFSIIELVVSVSIISFILLFLAGFVFQINRLNSKTTGQREVAQNASKVLDAINYEIKGAEAVYSPTTLQNQLSLETKRYLPSGEDGTFIDFFICGANICLKKESQSPISLMSEAVKVGNFNISRILTGGAESVKISLTVDYVNNTANPENDASINLTSTVSLRNY